jgi:hypothetical protein
VGCRMSWLTNLGRRLWTCVKRALETISQDASDGSAQALSSSLEKISTASPMPKTDDPGRGVACPNPQCEAWHGPCDCDRVYVMPIYTDQDREDRARWDQEDRDLKWDLEYEAELREAASSVPKAQSCERGSCDNPLADKSWMIATRTASSEPRDGECFFCRRESLHGECEACDSSQLTRVERWILDRALGAPRIVRQGPDPVRNAQLCEARMTERFLRGRPVCHCPIPLEDS